MESRNKTSVLVYRLWGQEVTDGYVGALPPRVLKHNYYPATLPLKHCRFNISFAPRLYYRQWDFKRRFLSRGCSALDCVRVKRLCVAAATSHPRPVCASLIHPGDSAYSSAATSPALGQSAAAQFPGHPIRRHLLKTVATATPMMDEESR